MPVSAIVGLGTAAYGIYSAAQAKKKQREADDQARKEMANRPDRAVSPYAVQALQEARATKNAVSPSALVAYEQLQQSAANQMGNVQRNASSGAQALAVDSSIQHQVDSAIPQLVSSQDAYTQQQRENYLRALSGMDAQHDMQYQDQMGRYSDRVNFSLGQVGAASANQSQGLQLAATGLSSLAGNYAGGKGILGSLRTRRTPYLSPLTGTGFRNMPTQNNFPISYPLGWN